MTKFDRLCLARKAAEKKAEVDAAAHEKAAKALIGKTVAWESYFAVDKALAGSYVGVVFGVVPPGIDIWTIMPKGVYRAEVRGTKCRTAERAVVEVKGVEGYRYRVVNAADVRVVD